MMAYRLMTHICSTQRHARSFTATTSNFNLNHITAAIFIENVACNPTVTIEHVMLYRVPQVTIVGHFG